MLDWLKRKLGLKPTKRQELINSEILGDIFNKMDESSLIVATNGDILLANDRFREISGAKCDAMHPDKVYDPKLGIMNESRFYYLMNELRTHGGKISYTEDNSHNTRGFKHVQVSVVMYTIGDEECMCYIAKDITMQKQNEGALRDLNQLLNVIIDNLPVYLFAKDVDNDFRYVLWNKAFAEYSKIPASKVIGKTDFEVFPDYNDALMFREDDINVLASGQDLVKKQETYIAADGTSRLVQTFKTIVRREGSGPMLVGMSLDMTDIQDIEKELVQERLRAEESDRLKSRFLANMSHEIRTPLNAIVGFAGLLADADDAVTRQEFSQIISQNTEVLLQLINDILDLSKIEAGTLEYTRQPMDLLELCHNIYHVHKGKVHEGVQFIFDNSEMEGQFMLNEDRNRIAQVIDNLINNAIKFTYHGEIRYGFVVKDDVVEVYVKDTGKGIPADKQQDVFNRFVKLDSFAQGTGLGLSICKLIVETLGGQMHLISELGRGSTFSFTIPYIEDRYLKHSEAEEPKAVEKKVAERSDSTILVAEDVQSNYLVVKALVKNRYNLIWAKNGIEAVQMVRDKRPDLVLMDIKMPEMNGLDATREIRAFDSKVPIVAITANAFENDRAVSLHAGMNDFLPKPVERDAFEEILCKYL